MKQFIIATTLGLLIFFSTETISITEQEPIVEAETENEMKVIDTVEVVTLELPEVSEPEPQYISLGEFLITAYCPCTSCSDNWSTQTSTGVTATEGKTIAVDPSVIPYGTVVTFGGNTYIAEDCGGAIKQKRIDLYFNDHQTALEWGKQYHEVFILITE